MHVISQNIDGGASAPVGPSVATPLSVMRRRKKVSATEEGSVSHI